MNSPRLPDAETQADHAAFVRAVARAALKGDDAVDDVVQDTYADGRYTYVSLESLPVPGTLEVVMRRCGHVIVATPFLNSTVEHDVVFRALDAEGQVVDTYTHPAGRYADVERPLRGHLKVYADGTYRIGLETNGKQVETEVDARVGHAVDTTLDPR